MQATDTVPIVVPGGADPVERGWVKSLARPGGNVTGFALLESSVIGKMLQTLKELAPSITRVAMLYNPDTGQCGRGLVRAVVRGCSSSIWHPGDPFTHPRTCRYRARRRRPSGAAQWRHLCCP